MTAQGEGRTGAQVERQADEPELPAIDGLYLDYLASYCDMLVVERNSSQHTVRNYRLDLLDSCRWAARSSSESAMCDATRYAKLFGRFGLCPVFSSHGQSAAVFRSFIFRWLVAEGLVESNPADVVSAPKLARSLPRTIPPADMVRFAFGVARQR